MDPRTDATPEVLYDPDVHDNLDRVQQLCEELAQVVGYGEYADGPLSTEMCHWAAKIAPMMQKLVDEFHEIHARQEFWVEEKRIYDLIQLKPELAKKRDARTMNLCQHSDSTSSSRKRRCNDQDSSLHK